MSDSSLVGAETLVWSLICGLEAQGIAGTNLAGALIDFGVGRLAKALLDGEAQLALEGDGGEGHIT